MNDNLCIISQAYDKARMVQTMTKDGYNTLLKVAKLKTYRLRIVSYIRKLKAVKIAFFQHFPIQEFFEKCFCGHTCSY